MREPCCADALAAYDGVPGIGGAERASEREVFEESVFLGLRLLSGLPWRRLEAFPRAWVQDLRETAQMLEAEGLLRTSADCMVLTGRGRLVSSEVFGELLTATLTA